MNKNLSIVTAPTTMPNKRTAERRAVSLPARLTWKDQRGTTRFASVVANWLMIMQRTKQLTFLTAGYTQVSVIFPFIVASPAYFAGAVQLGGLMQTASAFGSVQTALSYFVNAYRQIAEWRAVIERLEGFIDAVERAGGVASVMRVVDGAMVLPRPKPKMKPVRMRYQTGASTGRVAMSSMPTDASAMPNGITRRAPKRCTILALRGAASSCPTANGSVSRPLCSGDQPRTIW